jgi:hypothetical protein
VVSHKFVGHTRRAVIDRDLEAVIGNIEGEVLAHHGQAYQSYIGFFHGNLQM